LRMLLCFSFDSPPFVRDAAKYEQPTCHTPLISKTADSSRNLENHGVRQGPVAIDGDEQMVSNVWQVSNYSAFSRSGIENSLTFLGEPSFGRLSIDRHALLVTVPLPESAPPCNPPILVTYRSSKT